MTIVLKTVELCAHAGVTHPIGPSGFGILGLTEFFTGVEAFTALFCVEHATNDVKNPDKTIIFRVFILIVCKTTLIYFVDFKLR